MAELQYVIVRREPDSQMQSAARDWSSDKFGKPIGNDAARGCWSAMLSASPSPVSLEEIVEVLSINATMLEKQAPEIFPDVNEHGQVHFGRAVMESAAEELRSLLDRLASLEAKP